MTAALVATEPFEPTALRRHSFEVMGTVASLAAVGSTRDFARLVRIATTTLTDAHRRFNPFDPGSELGALRRGVPPQELSDDMRSVVDGCRLLSTITDGAFRATDPHGVPDTTGFVKGWAMRRVELAARAEGLADWLLNVGGDVVACGRNRDRPWRVAVRHPDHPARVLEIVPLTGGGAVATSGAYERGAHVWTDTGKRVSRPGSGTVVGPRIDVGDALATACWAAGTAEPGWLRRLPEYRVLIASADGVHTSAGFPWWPEREHWTP